MTQQSKPGSKNPQWHTRGYIPHFDGGEVPQSITFRLSDSLSAERLMYWSVQLAKLSPRERKAKEILLIDEHLDQGGGAAWLGEPKIAGLVERAMLHFDGVRYDLHAWVVMPNHVHVLFTPKERHSLAQIMRTWKSYTAKEANKILGRNGHFWQKEYFDRVIRNPHHFDLVKEYIENNPVKAGLCRRAEEWKFTSAGRDRPLWKPPSCWYEDAPRAAAAAAAEKLLL